MKQEAGVIKRGHGRWDEAVMKR